MGTVERRASRSSLVSFDLEISRGQSRGLSVYEDMDDVAKKESIGSESFPLLGGARGEDSFWNEIIRTWALAWPVVCTFFLQVGPGIISLMFVGHLPKKEYLAACTLATMYIHMTGNTVVIGMSTALDTLLSQAYGSGQLTKVRGFRFFFVVLRVFSIVLGTHILYLC
jgi:Na+-driven multidrug efflux pump